MKLKKAIRIGKECGLKSISECIRNIEIHSPSLFAYQKIDNELNELNFEINELSNNYDVSEEEVLNWSIKEAEQYV